MENNMHHVNINPNKNEVAILIFDKVYFCPKTRVREFHFIMKKRSINK